MNANKYAMVVVALAYYGMCYAAHVSLWAPIAKIGALVIALLGL